MAGPTHGGRITLLGGPLPPCVVDDGGAYAQACTTASRPLELDGRNKNVPVNSTSPYSSASLVTLQVPYQAHLPHMVGQSRLCTGVTYKSYEFCLLTAGVRMAERSKAPDSRANLALRWVFWSTYVGVGSNPTSDTFFRPAFLLPPITGESVPVGAECAQVS